MGKNTIILKNSSVPKLAPLPNQLGIGELAVNLNDRRVYSKDITGTVFPLNYAQGETYSKGEVDEKVNSASQGQRFHIVEMAEQKGDSNYMMFIGNDGKLYACGSGLDYVCDFTGPTDGALVPVLLFDQNQDIVHGGYTPVRILIGHNCGAVVCLGPDQKHYAFTYGKQNEGAHFVDQAYPTLQPQALANINSITVCSDPKSKGFIGWITEDGAYQGLGNNEHGQLGVTIHAGSNTVSAKSFPINPLHKYDAVWAGTRSVYARTDLDGGIHHCGSNWSGTRGLSYSGLLPATITEGTSTGMGGNFSTFFNCLISLTDGPLLDAAQVVMQGTEKQERAFVLDGTGRLWTIGNNDHGECASNYESGGRYQNRRYMNKVEFDIPVMSSVSSTTVHTFAKVGACGGYTGSVWGLKHTGTLNTGNQESYTWGYAGDQRGLGDPQLRTFTDTPAARPTLWSVNPQGSSITELIQSPEFAEAVNCNWFYDGNDDTWRVAGSAFTSEGFYFVGSAPKGGSPSSSSEPMVSYLTLPASESVRKISLLIERFDFQQQPSGIWFYNLPRITTFVHCLSGNLYTCGVQSDSLPALVGRPAGTDTYQLQRTYLPS